MSVFPRHPRRGASPAACPICAAQPRPVPLLHRPTSLDPFPSVPRDRGWRAAGALALCGSFAAWPSLAQTVLPTVEVRADPGLMCPLGGSSLEPSRILAGRAATSDTAQLLGGQPGVALQTGGALSSLPSLRGMADDRVRVMLDGMSLTSTCPNHMNPPLSYIDPTNVGAAQVLPGITPVSIGGDSLGGTITVDAPAPVFAAEGAGRDKIEWHATASTSYRSNGDGLTASGAVSASTDTVSLGYTGAWTKGWNYKDGNGHRVLASAYESANHAGTLGVRTGIGTFVLRAGLQNMPYQGFPNQRMDLLGNRSWYVNGSYDGDFGWGRLSGRLYYQDVRHYMNFLNDKGGRDAGGMPMRTHGTDLGYRIKAEIPVGERHTLRVGSDFEHYHLNDWWPPVSGSMMMGPQTFQNINDGNRTRFGVFAEDETRWTARLSTLLGLRLDTVWTDTGTVQPYSWARMLGMGKMAMPNPDAQAAAAFNALDRQRTDVNFDLTALARYEATDRLTAEIGYARATRSPNLYERYAWGAGSMAQSMVGWFGDANLYRGNVDLKPEIANTISLSGALHDERKAAWELRVTPYVTYVQDYIGADRVGTLRQGGSEFAMLRFANHDARLYGVDVSGRATVWSHPAYGRVGVSGVVGWVQGQYVNTDQSLYHMMPFNAQLAISHDLDGWASALELRMVAPKALVDSTRNEPRTPGFAVLNLRTSYTWRAIRLDLAIENLLNQQYYEPLGGVSYANWAAGGRQGQIGPLPAPGRSYIAGLTFKF